MELFYGVWIPGKGWLKIEGHIYADLHEVVVKQVAEKIGGAPLFIDDSIKQIEELYLEHERQKAVNKWRISINLLHSKNK
jgi:hypothetical protein